MRLSKNFVLSEFTKSDTATRLNIDNTPTGLVIDNLQVLVTNILQPLRTFVGRPIKINSGYRSLELNKVLKSKDTSQHILGQAVDIGIYQYSNLGLANIIQENYDFDQLILEFWSKEIDTSGWVHVSYSNNNRKELLTISKNGVFKGLGTDST